MLDWEEGNIELAQEILGNSDNLRTLKVIAENVVMNLNLERAAKLESIQFAADNYRISPNSLHVCPDAPITELNLRPVYVDLSVSPALFSTLAQGNESFFRSSN